MSTKERLAERLRQDGFDKLAERAAQGEFSDFEGPHATPKVMLVQELHTHMVGAQAAKALKLATEVMEDKWDDTPEESQAWFEREGANLLIQPEKGKPMTSPEAKQKVQEMGKLIESGWIDLRLAAVPADAPEIQIEEMRMAFFAGAQHLFASIMGGLEDGKEPTANDLGRMDAIHAELNQFVAAMAKSGAASKRKPASKKPAAEFQSPLPPRYEVRNAEAEQKLKEIGRMVKDSMPKGMGFMLMIFTLGPGGSMFYLSSAERQIMIQAMQEFIDKNREH